MEKYTEALEVFLEALTCEPSVYHWQFDKTGQLKMTNCPLGLVQKIFESVGCHGYMMEYSANHNKPLILSAELGIMWGACFSEERIIVIGPIYNAELSLERIRRAIDGIAMLGSVREKLMDVLQNVPIVSITTFFQYVILLNYFLNGEKVGRQDIAFQQRVTKAEEKGHQEKKDRHQTWMVEQALLEHIRKGDINYRDTMARASLVSQGVKVKMQDAVTNAIFSAFGFTRLCTRAAIEGGLSPEVAYTVGDEYGKSIIECKTVSEVATINHAMFEEFIMRVHKVKQNPSYSPQIQSCLDYVELYAEEEISLTFLAKRVGYSESHLSRRFKEETGENIKDYMRRVRVERGKLLLETSELSVQDISERLHYCSAGYFSKVFREETGMLPSEYRAEKEKAF